MSYPVARVGSLTKNGDKIISGVPSHLVDVAQNNGRAYEFNGQVIVFDAEDSNVQGNDEPEGAPARAGAFASSGKTVPPAITPNGTPAAAPTTPPPSSVVPADCSAFSTFGDFGKDDSRYGMQLSTNFTIAQLSSTTPAGHHVVRAQNGFTVPELLCNMKALCVNCLEPIRAHFGNVFIVNSGLRNESGISQHNRGMAADLFFPTFSHDQLLAAGVWMRDNVTHDQIIYERSQGTGTRWMHISFNRTIKVQRGLVNTCANAGGGNEQYPKGLFQI